MNEIPTRRAWAPFVGAALAMLTTGSLVVFALIAQRTSLDGFSNERVAAARPAGATPQAITISPVGGSAPSRTGSDDGSPDDGGTVVSVASPDVPVAAPSFLEIVTTSAPPLQGRDTVALGPGPDDVADDTGTVESPNQRLAEVLFARGGGGSPVQDEQKDEVVGSDPRHDGKHSHKSHDVVDKGRKSKKAKKAKKQRSKAHGSPARRNASSGSSASGTSPARRAPRSSPNAKRHSAPAPHSKARGNSRSRARGHGKR